MLQKIPRLNKNSKELQKITKSVVVSQKESEERCEKAKVTDRLRVKNEKLSEIEQEQKMKNESLQRKAMMQQQESEEQIKRLNKVPALVVSET